MSANSEVAVRALHALAGADMDALERLYSPDFVLHTQPSGRPQGYAGLRDRALLLSSALYDVSVAVKVVADSGDLVVSRWRGRAVHRGDLLGFAPTGRRVTVSGITIFRLRNGVVVDEWTEFDALRLIKQLRPAAPLRAVPSPRRTLPVAAAG
jgi:predicted ester cyclase